MEKKKKKRGFANMPTEKVKEMGSIGGKAARGKAYRFTSAKARAAGRKGGRNAQANGKAHRWDSAAAREAGAKGLAEKKRKQSAAAQPADSGGGAAAGKGQSG